MDSDALGVTMLLRALQEAMARLAQVSNHYSRLGMRPGRPHLTLTRSSPGDEASASRQSNGSVELALIVVGADDREYELVVELLWDDERWTILTEAWEEAERDGQALLRALPERSSVALQPCLAHLLQAVDDLVSFADLVPHPPRADG